jgi:hypothetical protein
VIRGESADAVVRTYVITPNNEVHHVSMIQEGCGMTGDKKQQCVYSGSYVLGNNYPIGKVEMEEEEILSQTPLEDAITQTSTDSITANVVAEEAKIMPPALKGRFGVVSVANLAGEKKGAKTFFFMWEYNEKGVNLILNSRYRLGDTVTIGVKNNYDEEILYTMCNGPPIEKYVKGEGYVRVDLNPCIKTECTGGKRLSPGEQVNLGQWDQAVYLNEDCNAKKAEAGLYRASFSYSKGSQESLSTVYKEFNIYSKDGCEPTCKAVGTRSEGWYDSCSGELIKYDTCGDTSCSGCTHEDKCLPYGTRLAKTEKTGSPVFCSLSSELSSQRRDGEDCQNNYECISNSCNTGKCIDLEKQLRETRNLVQRLWDWLSGRNLI